MKGKQSIIHSTALIFPGAIIGKHCVIHAHVIIGCEGLSLTKQTDGIFKPCKTACNVILKDNVHVYAGTMIQRGISRNTLVGKGTFIGPMCNIGHDTIIGENCVIAGMTQINGYVEIGDNVRINPGSTIRNRMKIGSNATIGIGSLIMQDVPEGAIFLGRPAVEINEFRRIRKRLRDL